MKFVLIGNDDHGKSTLGGSLLENTKTVYIHDIKKTKTRQAKEIKMDSWWLAYILDTDESERERGKTQAFMY